MLDLEMNEKSQIIKISRKNINNGYCNNAYGLSGLLSNDHITDIKISLK